MNLPLRPATVYPSTPLCTLSEDLHLADDEGGDGKDVELEDAEESTPASTSSKSSGFVFPESLTLAAVARKLKAVRVKAGRLAPAKLSLSSQLPLWKASHPRIPASPQVVSLLNTWQQENLPHQWSPVRRIPSMILGKVIHLGLRKTLLY